MTDTMKTGPRDLYFTFGLGMHLYKGQVMSMDLNSHAVLGLFLGDRFVHVREREEDSARTMMSTIFGSGNWCGPYTADRFKRIQLRLETSGRRLLRELEL